MEAPRETLIKENGLRDHTLKGQHGKTSIHNFMVFGAFFDLFRGDFFSRSELRVQSNRAHPDLPQHFSGQCMETTSAR
jgi:hypothetical protein